VCLQPGVCGARPRGPVARPPLLRTLRASDYGRRAGTVTDDRTESLTSRFTASHRVCPMSWPGWYAALVHRTRARLLQARVKLADGMADHGRSCASFCMLACARASALIAASPFERVALLPAAPPQRHPKCLHGWICNWRSNVSPLIRHPPIPCCLTCRGRVGPRRRLHDGQKHAHKARPHAQPSSHDAHRPAPPTQRLMSHALHTAAGPPSVSKISHQLAARVRCCTTLHEPFGAEQIGQCPVDSIHC